MHSSVKLNNAPWKWRWRRPAGRPQHSAKCFWDLYVWAASFHQVTLHQLIPPPSCQVHDTLSLFTLYFSVRGEVVTCIQKDDTLGLQNTTVSAPQPGDGACGSPTDTQHVLLSLLGCLSLNVFYLSELMLLAEVDFLAFMWGWEPSLFGQDRLFSYGHGEKKKIITLFSLRRKFVCFRLVWRVWLKTNEL